MKDYEILMADGCTKMEAEKHLMSGTMVFEAEEFEKHLEEYMKEWDLDEEEK